MTNLDIATLEASVEALIQQQVAAYEGQLREALGRKLSGGQGKQTQDVQVGLSLPASRLKKTGRVKTVGERSRTRYYAVTP
ncbi:MAG: hypothetical protein GXP55_25740, partial [Deltaproteobacteria bacterium]|nr:hypothetical protein [Deltaproteobacteria bacterium]